MFGLLVIGWDTLIVIIYGIIATAVGVVLVKSGLHSSQNHFKNMSLNTVTTARVIFEFEDGLKTVGKFYRSISQTISTSEGRRYPDPRPAVVFFHGFRSKKESSERLLIPLASYGYIGFSFDQRGHGEAGSSKGDRFQIFNDARAVIDRVCAANDVRGGGLCCIGISLGGTSVLTKCYEDKRVAMVVGMSTFHSIDAFGKVRFHPFSVGKFFRWIMTKTTKKDKKTEPRDYLKSDPEYNKNRVFLIHGRKDVLFPPEMTFELNKQQAGIPEEHALLLENAGHGLDDQELLVLTTLIKWMSENEATTL